MAIDVRPVSGMEELERWVSIHNRVSDEPNSASLKALVRAQESGHHDLLAYLDGEAVGTGMLANDAESQESGRPWVEVNVLPDRRGRGIGGALFEALSGYARERGATGFACRVRADDPYSRGFLERRGFVPYGEYRECVLELGAPAPEPVMPDGVELAWFDEQPSFLDGMHAVALATYPELGGHRARQAERFVDWQVYELGSPDTILAAVPLAVVSERVVGFSTVRMIPGGVAAEVRTVAVLPPWRRRGVASALLRAQLGRVQAAGVGHVSVWVRHSWPIDLFRTLGFREAEGSILLRGPLL